MVRAGMILAPAAPGLVRVNVGILPQVVLLFGTCQVGLDQLYSPPAQVGGFVGYASFRSPTDRTLTSRCVYTHSKPNRRGGTMSRPVNCLATGGNPGSVAYRADLAALDSTGFTLDFTIAAAPGCPIFWVAFGSVQATEIVHHCVINSSADYALTHKPRTLIAIGSETQGSFPYESDTFVAPVFVLAARPDPGNAGFASGGIGFPDHPNMTVNDGQNRLYETVTGPAPQVATIFNPYVASSALAGTLLAGRVSDSLFRAGAAPGGGADAYVGFQVMDAASYYPHPPAPVDTVGAVAPVSLTGSHLVKLPPDAILTMAPRNTTLLEHNAHTWGFGIACPPSAAYPGFQAAFVIDGLAGTLWQSATRSWASWITPSAVTAGRINFAPASGAFSLVTELAGSGTAGLVPLLAVHTVEFWRASFDLTKPPELAVKL